MFEFELSDKQKQLKEALRGLGKNVIRPSRLEWDRNKDIPLEFLRNFYMMSASMRGGNTPMAELTEGAPDAGSSSSGNRTAAIAAEELAWADASIMLSVPGPGLGGPPVRSS